jgi:uncharacterized membrane protein
MPPISQDPVARFAERQDWILPTLEVAAQEAIRKPFQQRGAAGDSLLSFLHGEWLHEPLHAVLTDVPIGAWTVTVAADALSGICGLRSMNKVADVALAVGMAGAVGAATTGLVDWSGIKEAAPRRIGSAHALLNVGATTLFVLSALARRREGRPLARSLAIAGYLVLCTSAHLGGNLVYEHGIGLKDAAKTRWDNGQAADLPGHSMPRDPEDRPVSADDIRARREKNLDKTLADSFPTSDPPSSIPDPVGEA